LQPLAQLRQKSPKASIVRGSLESIILRAKLHASNIPQANITAISIRPDHDVFELTGVREPTKSLHGELERAGRVGGRLVDGAGGQVKVRRRRGGNTYARRQPAVCNLGGGQARPSLNSRERQRPRRRQRPRCGGVRL